MSYFRPDTIENCCLLLEKHGGKIIAGGTDLVVRMEKGIEKPKNIIDISWLPLNKVELINEGETVVIGSLVTMSDLIDNEVIKSKVPILSQAAADVAAPQIRNRATIGGNIANASPAGDGVCALGVYDPQFEIWGPSGSHLVEFKDFFKGPGKTVLKSNEIIAKIHISLNKPSNAVKEYSHWFKLGNRTASVISIVAFAGRTWLDSENKIIKSRFSVASVAPVPHRSHDVEKYVEGKVINDELIDIVAKKVGESVTPISDLRASAKYRRHLAAVFARKHLMNFKEGRSQSFILSEKPEYSPDGNNIDVPPVEGEVEFTLNGEKVKYSGNYHKRLLDVLRDDFYLTGTKNGCSEGECGACTVLLNGLPVNSCMVLAGNVSGSEITTIEGLQKDNGEPGIVQQSFIDAGAVQCGFCIPGFEVTAHHFINSRENANREEIKNALSGNLCRCTGYVKIIDAVELAMKRREDDNA